MVKLAAQQNQSAETLETIAVFKKVAWRLVPFLCFCYIASYLDRINIGFAKLQMLDDLQFSEVAYGFGAGLFFLGYILFEVPSNLVLQRVGARLWIARIMVSWGIFSGLTMFVTTPLQFYSVRFLLGVAEAGFLPGVLYYLTTWFPSYRRGRIMALFIIGLPLATVIGGPLSGFIMTQFAGLNGWNGWQWLFLLEAVPTIILGLMAIYCLPDNYDKAHWLNIEEKALIHNAMQMDQLNETHAKHSLRDGLLNIKVWMLGGIDFSILLCTYALGFWLPSFIKNTGIIDPLIIGLLTAIPGIFAVLSILLLGASSDYHRERRFHIIIPFIIGGTAMITSTFFVDNVFATVFLFSVASAMIIGTVPVFFALPATFLKGTAAATGFALAISLANIAGLVSNALIGLAINLTGSASGALWIFAAFLALSCCLVALLPARLVNR
ncbi:MFS transporter (plasmid) [Bartonella sp. HY329]|uniref:MFS transporter n=1 Tax=unclassified Bartonella TaxID=2645622 RepID=UPI0021C84030|nr:MULTISPECIES: MFS transporter [unclassified Bartonella]UXM96576.1 MFS transporter [Bartonella sp. HY329]UXN10899.1 MFS transporter [Bartonella sp. HY328]